MGRGDGIVKWIVQHRDELDVCWGPFDDETTAQRFAEFASKEIDPVVVRPVRRDPLAEVLAFYGQAHS